MTLYFYHFDTNKKMVLEETAEVEEKPKSYVAVNGVLPFLYISKVLKSDLNDEGLRGRSLVYITTEPDHKKAVRLFRKYWGQKAEQYKAIAEQYDDYCKSCFKFTRKEGTVFVP